MRRGQKVPVQVESVTDEELQVAVGWDWANELRQRVRDLRPKLLCLRQSGIIGAFTAAKLQHLQGILMS